MTHGDQAETVEEMMVALTGFKDLARYIPLLREIPVIIQGLYNRQLKRFVLQAKNKEGRVYNGHRVSKHKSTGPNSRRFL